MTRRVFLSLWAAALMALYGCGKKGPIEPPLVRIPQTVQDFSVLQRGARVFLSWTNPEAYIDGNPISSVAGVEVWLVKEDHSAESTSGKWTKEDFENKAELLTRISSDRFSALRSPDASGAEFAYVYTPDEEDFGRKVLTFSLRVREEKKRLSDFSEPASLELQSPPSPPRRVRAEVFEDHIQVLWEDAAGTGREAGPSKPEGYDLYRSEGEGPALRLNSVPIEKQEYSDGDFSFGQTYRYFVRAVMEGTPRVESDDSEPAEVQANDTFPPAPPSGLTVIGGSGFIALSWEAGRESDLGGYRVWRRPAGEAEFGLLASLTAAESSFQDSKVEKNVLYEYAITALDVAGNESRMSEPARGSMRENPPT